MSPPSKAKNVAPASETLALAILLAASISHLFNDTIQAVIPAVYPLLKERFTPDFVQVGLITLAFQMTASLLQPFIGLNGDCLGEAPGPCLDDRPPTACFLPFLR